MQDSDVDGGLCRFRPEETTNETFGLVPADYEYSPFEDELEEALVVHSWNKA